MGKRECRHAVVHCGRTLHVEAGDGIESLQQTGGEPVLVVAHGPVSGGKLVPAIALGPHQTRQPLKILQCPQQTGDQFKGRRPSTETIGKLIAGTTQFVHVQGIQQFPAAIDHPQMRTKKLVG